MTLLVEKGTFTKTTSTSTPVDQTVTLSNSSLTPKLVILWTTGQTTNDGTYVDDARLSYGFSDGTTDACQALRSDESAELESYTFRTDSAICIINLTTNAIVSQGDISAFNAGNFHINWSVQSNTSAMVIHYIVAGGTDITNVSVVNTTVGDTSTGNHSYNGSGTTFTPDFALCMTGTDDAAGTDTLASSGDDALFCIGAAKSTSARWVMWGRVETIGTSDTDMYLSPSACLAACSQTAGTITFLADFVSFNSAAGGGITVNVSDGATSASQRLAFLLVKGGVWDCGAFQQRSGTGTQDVTIATGLDPEIVFLGGINSTSSATVATNNYIGIGASDGTNEGASYFGSTNGAATWADVNSNLNTKVYRNATPNATATSSTTNAECDMTGMSTAGQFTLDWTTADTTQRRMAYWVLGTQASVDYPRNLEDTVTVGGGTLDRVYGANRTSEDTTTSGETLDRKFDAFRTLPETTSSGETLDRSGTFSRTLSDTVGSSELLERIAGFPRTIVEGAISVGESLARLYGANRGPSDTTSSGETLDRRLDLFRKAGTGNSIKVDGVDDFVNCGSETTLWSKTHNKFSFSLWFKPNQNHDIGTGLVDTLNGFNLVEGDGAFTVYIDDFVTNPKIAVQFSILGGVGDVVFSSALAEPNLRWWHALLTFDKDDVTTNIRLYLNGDLDNDAIFTNALPVRSDAPLNLGGFNVVDGQSKCNIKDFRFWENIKLTDQQAADVFNNSSNAPTPSYWLKMREGTGNPVDNISGTKTGVLTNGATWSLDCPDSLIYEETVVSGGSVTRVIGYPREIIEAAISVGESVVRAFTGTRTLSDTTGSGETLDRRLDAFRLSSDTTGSSDLVDRIIGYPREITEAAISVGESLLRKLDAFRSSSDTTGSGENLTRSGSFSRALSDNVPIGESLNRVVEFFRSLNDTTGVGESLTKVYNGFRGLSDTILSSESVQRVLGLFRSSSDTASSGEQLDRSLTANRALSDTTPSSENLSKSVGSNRSLSDTISVDGIVSRITALFRSIAQSIGISELLEHVSTGATQKTVVNTDIPILITEWLANNWTNDPVSTAEHYLIPPKSKITFGSRFDMSAGSHSDMHVHVRNVSKNIEQLSTDATVEENSAMVNIYVEVRYIPDTPPDFSGINAGAPSDMMWQIRSYIDELIRSDPQQLLNSNGIEIISIMQEIPDANTPADVHAQNVIEDMYTIIITVKCFYTLEVDRQI